MEKQKGKCKENVHVQNKESATTKQGIGYLQFPVPISLNCKRIIVSFVAALNLKIELAHCFGNYLKPVHVLP